VCCVSHYEHSPSMTVMVWSRVLFTFYSLTYGLIMRFDLVHVTDIGSIIAAVPRISQSSRNCRNRFIASLSLGQTFQWH